METYALRSGGRDRILDSNLAWYLQRMHMEFDIKGAS